MLKYLLGILTALLFVAAFVIWSSLQDDAGIEAVDDNRAGVANTTAKDGQAGADGNGSGGVRLFPRANSEAETRGLDLDADDTAGAVAGAPMRQEVIATLGLAIDVPEAWMKLDATGMRRYFSEFQGFGDQQLVDALVSGIVLATIRDWPEDGVAPNVFISHQLAPQQDVVQILNTRLDQKRNALDALAVIAPPALGQLGPFWGASMRTRETVAEADGSTVSEAVVWVLRVADGYLFITAEASVDDEEGLVLIERILDSVSAARTPG